jgi:hypothetical protein
VHVAVADERIEGETANEFGDSLLARLAASTLTMFS